MSRLFHIIVLAVLPLCFIKGQAQERERFIQVTGIIMDESEMPVSNAGVISASLRRGTLSDRSGIYSIISRPGDTLFFRALGFKITEAIVPGSFEGRHLKIDVVLYGDTIKIEDVVIMPWRSYEEFKKEITAPRPVDPEIANMNENLASIYASIANSGGATISPEAGFRYAMEQNFNALSTKNQYPVNNLLNPFAWAKLFSGVKNGLFRNQKSDNPVSTKSKPKKKKTGED